MMSYHTKMYQQQKIVYWVCDKLDCGKRNYRVLSSGEIINMDRCDHCYSKIQEPITQDSNEPTHNSESDSDLEKD